MTDENKQAENANGQDGGEINPLETKLKELETALEAEKNRAKGLDAAINKINKEKADKELASKTAEEQAETYRKKAELLERKEAYRQSFKDAGLDPDKFLEIINETDPKSQASKFAEILTEKTTQSANDALEAFKKENLQKIPSEAKPKGGAQEDVIELAFKRGLGLK